MNGSFACYEYVDSGFYISEWICCGNDCLQQPLLDMVSPRPSAVPTQSPSAALGLSPLVAVNALSSLCVLVLLLFP